MIPTIGVPLMRDCYVDDIRSWASPAASDDGISQLISTIRSVMEDGTLGVPMGRETALRVPLADILRIIAALDDIELADVTPEIQHIRMVKSPAEIAKLTHVCGIVSDVFATIPDWAHAGLPLSDLFRQFKIRALEAGVDDVSYLVGSAGPGGYYDIIAPPNDRRLATGDVFMLDTGSVWDGYFSDFDRNFAIGHASDGAYAGIKRCMMQPMPRWRLPDRASPQPISTGQWMRCCGRTMTVEAAVMMLAAMVMGLASS